MSTLDHDKILLSQTQDLHTAEIIAHAAIIRNAFSGGLDNEFVSDALAKQINLGANGRNAKVREEASRAGLFSKGEPRESTMVQDSIHEGNEWNASWFYLATDFLDENIPGAVTEPFDRAMQLTEELRNNGLDIEEAKYIEAEDWNDGTFNFGTQVPDQNPGVYRVWVRVGHKLQQMVEEKTQPSAKPYTK